MSTAMFGDVTLENALRCVGLGWAPIIQRLYQAKPEQTKVIQVKEKFGGLRFYVENSTPEFNQLIREAEKESFTTCESCGITGDFVETKTNKDGYWLLTLCAACRY